MILEVEKSKALFLNKNRVFNIIVIIMIIIIIVIVTINIRSTYPRGLVN